MLFLVNVDAAPLLAASNTMEVKRPLGLAPHKYEDQSAQENREHSQGLQMFAQRKRITSAPNDEDTTDVFKIDARAPDQGAKQGGNEGGNNGGNEQDKGEEKEKGKEGAKPKPSGGNHLNTIR